MLGRQDTPAGGDLESKLMWRFIRWSDGHSFQAKRIGSRRVDAAIGRAATVEPRVLYDFTVGVGDVLAAAVGIGEGIDSHANLALEFLSGAEHFVARLGRRHLAEVDVAAGEPSKWLTLSGTRVLAWWDAAQPTL